MPIAENIAQIESRIASACRRAGRSRESVRLMAVSKMHPPAAIREAYAAGLRLFGENRVQEFAAKSPDLSTLHDTEFSLIGHLQSNKSAKAVELFTSIQSLDSLRLAHRLNESAIALGKRLPVLIEIKIGYEESKHGIVPDSTELTELLEVLPSLASLDLRGLMTVPPYSDDPNLARPVFQQLRSLRDKLAAQYSKLNFDDLSMGMSHDFEVAIEEGSTCVRIGTAIFGERVKA
jgi:pyridoxal phosphate enzyme (YggS family)